jgi:Trypsin
MRAWSVGAGTALAFLCSASGCSSESARPDVPVASAASAVQGGTLDQTHPFAVGVCGGGKGNCSLVCSGALIAPNLVVTARHCVSNISNTEINCATDTFGSLLAPANSFWITTNYNLFQSTTGWHQVAKIVTPTPTRVCGNDLALLILTSNVSPGEATPITPAVQFPITDHTRYSTTDTAIGYGVTTPTNTNTAGQRHIRQNIEIQCIPGDKQLDCGALAGKDLDTKEFLAGDGTCEGDSGSSAYEQLSFNANKPVSLGVLSRGGVSLDGQTCVSAVYTRLDSWKDLIIQTAQQAAQQGAYPPPAWTIGGTTPPADAGASADSGATTGPAAGQFGATCDSDDACGTKTCRSINGGSLICTSTCDGNNACPDSYTCAKGFCFPKADTGNSITRGTTSSGCGVAAGEPVSFYAIGLGLLLGLCLRRTKR